MTMRTSKVGNSDGKQQGFTLPLLLILVMVMGIASTTTYRSVSQQLKREKEQELLFRGQQYIKALQSYYDSGQPRQFPRKMEHLLKDPRFLNRRHIRRLYSDPFDATGHGWILIYDVSGGIAGVASRSKERPLREKNFPPGLEKLTQQSVTHYSDWQFRYYPKPRLSQADTIPRMR